MFPGVGCDFGSSGGTHATETPASTSTSTPYPACPWGTPGATSIRLSSWAGMAGSTDDWIVGSQGLVVTETTLTPPDPAVALKGLRALPEACSDRGCSLLSDPISVPAFLRAMAATRTTRRSGAGAGTGEGR